MVEVEEMRMLTDNRVLFLRLLGEKNRLTFQELLIEHPNYIHISCSDRYGVSV